MTILLNRAYAQYAQGQTVTLTSEVEAALISQGYATTAAATATTTGPVTTSAYEGLASIPIGSSSVVITNPNVDANTFVSAVVCQAAADATLLRVERVLPAAGSFTIYGTANATAATLVRWCLPMVHGDTIRN
jgi:hypothetical protein